MSKSLVLMLRSIGIALLVSLLAGPAYAIDFAYYTYGTFEPLRDTLVLVQGFINDTEFDNWVFVFAVVGIAITAITSMLSPNGDDGGSGLARKLVIALFVAGVVLGLVNTNGNLNVYDPVLNETETVPVSNLVVLTAGTINAFERSLVDVFDSLSISGTHAFEDEAGFVSWRLLYNAAREARPIGDPYLSETIKSYYLECVTFVASVPSSGVTIQSLKKGSSSTDLKAEFAKAGTWESVFSTVYTAADKNGTPQTCKDAWSGQTYSIKERLEASGAFDSFFNEICARSGYNASSSPQLARCKARADVLIPNLIGVTGDSSILAQNAAIAAAMASVAFDEDIDVAVTGEINRGIVGDGVNNQIAWGEWGQLFRGVALTISLLAVPILLLFLFTPVAGAVMRALLGLFAFNAFWGVFDVAAFHVINLVFQNALEELRNSHLGYDTFMTAPGLMTKTLAAYGVARVGVIGLASLVAVSVFRLPAYSFAQLGNAYGQKLDGAADKANEIATNPVARSEFNNRQSSGLGDIAARHRVSPEAYDRSMAQTSMGSAVSSVSAFQISEGYANAQGKGYSEFKEAEGAIGAGRAVGQTEGYSQTVGSIDRQELFDGARDITTSQTQMEASKWQSFNKTLRDRGFSASEAGHLQGIMMQHSTMGDSVKTQQLDALAQRQMRLNPGMSAADAHTKASEDWHIAHNISSLAETGHLQVVGEGRIMRAAQMDAARKLGETEGAASQVVDMHALGRASGTQSAARTMGVEDAYGGVGGRLRADTETDTLVSSARTAGKRNATDDFGGIDVFRIERAASFAEMAQQIGHVQSFEGRTANEIAALKETESGVQLARSVVMNTLAERAWKAGQGQEDFSYGSLDAVKHDLIQGAAGSDMDITFDGRLGSALRYAGVISDDMYNSLNGVGEIRLSVGESGTTANVFGRSGDETDVRDGVVRHTAGISADNTAVLSRYLDEANPNAMAELQTLTSGILNGDLAASDQFAGLYVAAASYGGRSGTFSNSQGLEYSGTLSVGASASAREKVAGAEVGGNLRTTKRFDDTTSVSQDQYHAAAYAFMADLRSDYYQEDSESAAEAVQEKLRDLAEGAAGHARNDSKDRE